MGKCITLCFDGTWNAPDVKDAKGTCFTPTNVQKVFESLVGSGPLSPADQEKECPFAPTDKPAIVGKYIYGVGASENSLVARFDGAFGNGLIMRIVRGYTYLSRQYQPGDDIVIVGFSRGAYTARALAGFVTKYGLLNWQAMDLQGGSLESYSAGLAAWQQYKSSLHCEDPGFLTAVQDAVSNFQDQLEVGAFSAASLKIVKAVTVRAVAVWETVGAMGIPELHDANGTVARKDIFQFADLDLNTNVASGFHAIAIDERRVDFTPTLWNDREGVVQVLFPGAHSDVGGGYAPSESGLANCALVWMTRQLRSVGVLFAQDPPGQPNAQDVQHQPWAGTVFLTAPRGIRPGLRLSYDVLTRSGAASVPIEGAAPAPYWPVNLLGSYFMSLSGRVAANVDIEMAKQESGPH